MDIPSVFENMYNYYQADCMRLVGLITWFIAWRAAYLMSKNIAYAFQAHILYSVSNCFLLAFNVHYGHFEMAAMAFTFLITSIKGCFTYRSSNINYGGPALKE